jgi:hypothetical protein
MGRPRPEGLSEPDQPTRRAWARGRDAMKRATRGISIAVSIRDADVVVEGDAARLTEPARWRDGNILIESHVVS